MAALGKLAPPPAQGWRLAGLMVFLLLIGDWFREEHVIQFRPMRNEERFAGALVAVSCSEEEDAGNRSLSLSSWPPALVQVPPQEMTCRGPQGHLFPREGTNQETHLRGTHPRLKK